MSGLFRSFFQLVLFRVTPQELPGHMLVLWISAAAAFVTGIAGMLFGYSFTVAIVRSLLAIIVPGILVYAMLGARNLQPRFIKVYSAMCGSAAVIYLIALPLMPAFFDAVVNDNSGRLVIYLVLLLDLWTLAVTAFILKHAFDIGWQVE